MKEVINRVINTPNTPPCKPPKKEEVMNNDIPLYEKETPEIMEFFKYDHLENELQIISRDFCDLAKGMVNFLSDSEERQAMLRKLLEAKDCAVRACLLDMKKGPQEYSTVVQHHSPGGPGEVKKFANNIKKGLAETR